MSLPLSGLVRRLPHELGSINFDRRRPLPQLARKPDESRLQPSVAPELPVNLQPEIQNLSLQVSRQEIQLQKFQTELACLQTELSGLSASTRSGALPGQVSALEKKQAVLSEAVEGQSQVYHRLQEAVKHASAAAQEAFESSIAIPGCLLRDVQALDERGQIVELSGGQRLSLRFPASENNGTVYLRNVAFVHDKENAEIRFRVLQVPVCQGEEVYVTFEEPT